MKFLFVGLLFWIALTGHVLAQGRRDSAAVFSFSASYAYQVPAGDMMKRFGDNSAISGGFHRKTKNNWLYGVSGSFLFGDQIKEAGILENISTARGAPISNVGRIALLRLYERGFSVMMTGGKIFPLLPSTPNSGIMVAASVGYLQHEIRIEVIGNDVPQLNDDYKKGYDRLTGGVAFSGFVGYHYMGSRRLINFYAGFEYMIASTRSLRGYNYDLMSSDNALRSDILYGLKAGWIIPLYKRKARDYYVD